MRYVYIHILLLICIICNSQVRFNINLSIGTDTLLDVGVKVIELTNRQILSCGTSSHPFANYKSGYLIKTDSLGNLLWKKQYDISVGGSDFFVDLVELQDSTYLIGGTTSNTVTGFDEAFLTKIDTGGNIVWLKKYAYSNANEQCRGIRLTPDNKVVIIGNTFSATGYRDGLLIKTDIAGNLIWRKTITNTTGYDEIYYNIDVIKNNHEYIVSGMKGYYDGGGNSYCDFSLIRTDTAGNVLWQQQYGFPSIDETGTGGTTTLDSGYVLSGTYNYEAAIIKIDKQGNQQWFKNYGFSSNSRIYQVIQLPDSSFIMITSDTDWANTNRTGYLLKADKNGDLLWKRIYPHPPTTPNIANYFFGFNTTHDKGFIITGQYNHIGQPYQNMWLVKTDSLGCDSVGGCSYLPTGTKEQTIANTNKFIIYPNPNKGSFEISFYGAKKEGAEVTVVITNIVGQVVYSKQTDSKNTIVKTENLQQGIYTVVVSNRGGVIGQSKLKLLSK